MQKLFLSIGAILGGLAVALGATENAAVVKTLLADLVEPRGADRRLLVQERADVLGGERRPAGGGGRPRCGQAQWECCRRAIQTTFRISSSFAPGQESS